MILLAWLIIVLVSGLLAWACYHNHEVRAYVIVYGLLFAFMWAIWMVAK